MFKSIKLPIVVLVLSLVITFFGFSGSSATLSLNQSLQNQLAAVTTTLPKVITTKPVVPPYQFARTLKLGSTGPDVKTLQIYLNQDPTTIVATKGLGSPNNETTYYGPATSKAVSKFQLKYKSDILTPNHLTSPTGQFGPATLKKLNSLLALSTTSLLTTTLTTTTPSTTPVSTFSRTLKLGSTGSDVKQLQIFLNSDPTTRIALSGPGSPGQETTYYGSLTSKAVSLFQQKYQVTAANGVIDTPTLQKLNSIITTLNTSNTTSSAGGSTVVTTGGGGSGGPSGGGSSAVTTSGGGGGGSGGGGGTMPPAGGGGGGGGGTSPPVVPNPPTPPTPPAPPGAIITPGSGFTSATPQPPNQGSSSQFGYNDNAIARWDVVPYQTFSGNFNVGVVAFHNSGIDHVAFSVNNGPWTNISQMALNQQTGNMTGIGNPSPGTTEYWATLQSSSFPTDGQIEVRAIAYPTTGVPRVLPSLYLNSNNNRTLNERYVYVSPTGNDSMADGTQEHPYQTLLAAATYNTGGHGHKTSADNLTIYLEEGDYSWPAAVWNENPSNSTGWLTVASAPGTNPFHVRITSVVNGSSGFNTPLIHLNNLTVGDGVKGTTLVGNQGVSTQSLWIDTVNLAGPGIKVNLNGVVVNGFGNSYWTNVYMHDHSGHINGTLIRNTAVTNAAVAYQNAGIMINSTASNIYVPKGTTYHNDILQYYQTNSGWGNDIVYGLTATDHVPSQGLTLGPAPVLDFAAVNLDLENYGNGESIFQAQGQTITNLYIKNSTFIGSASWNRIVPPGFSAHDIVFDGVTFSQASMYKPVDGVSFVNTPPAITSPVMNTVTSMTSSGGHIMPYGVAALANRASQQYTITADSGYTVDQVLVDGQPVSLTNGTYTFNNVTADHNIIASFTSVATAAYTLTVTATNGSITVNPNQSTYTIGTQVTLTATPTSGYQFGSWSGGVGGTNNPLTITMNSDETITANFVQAPSSPANLTAGLIAYYPLDGNVNDLSGNNYNGTLVGTSTYITGKFGQALQITDYTNYVGLNKLPQTLGTVHSFAFWAKTNSDTLTDCIFINANSMANAVRLVGDNLTYGVSDASASVPTGTIANGWHHFAIVRNDTSVTFYKDGTLLGTAQTLATDSVFNTTYGYGRIGGAQYQHPNGAVDDFRIYNRALSAGDVATLYNGTLSYHEVTPSLATTQNPSFLASVFLSVQNVFNAVDDYIFAR